MKNQQVKERREKKRRGIIIAALLIAAIIVTLLMVYILSGDKHTDELLLDDQTPVEDKSADIYSETEDNEIIFSINGIAVPMPVFRYYLYSSFSRLENKYTTNELNFSTMLAEEITLGQYVIKNSIDGVRFNMIVQELAQDLKIDRVMAETEINDYIINTIMEAFAGDEDAFREQLGMMGTTLESFRDIMISQSLGSQVFEYYFGESWVSKVDPSEYYDQFVTVSDILIYTVTDDPNPLTGERMQKPFDDEIILQRRALTETILGRLKAGEDFFQLLDEFGEDPSVMLENNPEQRHTFQRNERIYEFSVAAFSTDVGEYSDIVETPHGYYIIYRLPLDTGTVAEAVKTQMFRSDLFNLMLDDISKDYTFEPTALYEDASLDNWYKEYKEKNFQAFGS